LVAPAVLFNWFEYAGHDKVFEQPAPQGSYRNPILPGFYPDPSVVRVGHTFYLVNSSFGYFPGIPVFESADLVNWRQIGNVIDRPSQLHLQGHGVSRGIFAPSISYHNGVFYLITTAVDAGGNFLSVARDPSGPWSDPIWLKQLDGIDPSLFFDADGKVYVLNNGPPEGPPQYNGHRAIWIQELNAATRKLVGPRKVLVNGGVDFSKKPVWIEGPHLYRHEGWYYLMCAEGGTSLQHSEVVLRSHSPWGPFKPFPGNPILTQRDLPADRADPVINTGHADLVMEPASWSATESKGRWWAVFLGSRAYEGIHYNTGRETYLLPVEWRAGWPVILDRGKAVPYVVPGDVHYPGGDAGPGGGAGSESGGRSAVTGDFVWRDDFDSRALKLGWLQLREPQHAWFDLDSHPGWLAIQPLPVALQSLDNPSFLAHRQQHLAFDASTELQRPQEAQVRAGLVAFQNETHWYFLAVTGRELLLEKRSTPESAQVLARVTLPAAGVPTIKLRISGNARAYSFFYDADGAGWKPLLENDDGSILSTDIAGGFVGTVVGPYAFRDPPAATR
jgi:xylan 1,4-beta-xylosidase